MDHRDGQCYACPSRASRWNLRDHGSFETYRRVLQCLIAEVVHACQARWRQAPRVVLTKVLKQRLHVAGCMRLPVAGHQVINEMSASVDA
jgi:hypothetical protein